jgi:hypothetical protein
MTKSACLTIAGLLATVAIAFAQESPAPSATALDQSTPTTSPSPSSVRSVRISFVPPPLEGTISLGIYDSTGKLVRVLHQQAPLEAFDVGADSLQTKWDGKDDDGQELPAGKYHAHGYAIGALQVTTLADDSEPSSTPPSNTIAIRLTANPLLKNDRPTIQLGVGFDDTDSFLKTTDELPLYVISERADISSIVVSKSGDKSIDIWQESGAGTEHLRISKLDQMMAFDCGMIDLK